jgi:hypothetical protein
VGGNETVGWNGTGTFNHSSSTQTITGDLFLARNTNTSSGTFNMSSGSLQVGGNEIIGAGSDGSLTHTSGTHTVGGNFILGRDAGTTGNFTMTSGSLTVGGLADIGRNGTGNFTMTSGSTTIAGKLTLAKNADSTGKFTITSGSVTSNNSPLFDGTADILIKAPDGTGAGGTFNVNTATVTGDVVNDGTVNVGPKGKVTWNGTFTNNNAYMSDRSIQNFNDDLVVSQDGYLQATANTDLFRIRGDFISNSTKNVEWNTNRARLVFAKGGVENDKIHDLYVTGENIQPVGDVPITSIVANYAWRLLNITNQEIHLVDGNATPDGALYVGQIIGADFAVGPNVVNNIFGEVGSVLDIFYDPDVNPLLGGLAYNWANGPGLGRLRPYHTPVPPSVLLLGTGLFGPGGFGLAAAEESLIITP